MNDPQDHPYRRAFRGRFHNTLRWAQFDALMDPDTFCKPSDKLDLASTTGKQVLTMTDFFRGDRFCPKVKKQFLWVVVTAGW